MTSFLKNGYRLIIPQLNLIPSLGRLHSSTTHSTSIDISHQARLIADLIQHLRSHPLLPQPIITSINPDPLPMTDSQKIKSQAIQNLSELDQAHEDHRSLQSDHRPMFLLGLGHSALIALSYPVEIISHFQFNPLGSPSTISLPSLSIRAEPSETLLNKLNTFCGSIHSGLAHTGWWAKDPHGHLSSKSGLGHASKPMIKRVEDVQVDGIIAIGPSLDPHQEVMKSNHLFKRFHPR